MKRLIIIFLFLAAPLLAQEEPQNVAIGVPALRINISGTDDPSVHFLTQKEKLESKCEIAQKDGKYFWVSRENRQLIKNDSGAYIVFMEPISGSVIKISGLRSDKHEYMEILHFGLNVIIYYGNSL